MTDEDPMSSMNDRERETLTVNGDPMVMTFYYPPTGQYEQAVLIASAMAVSQRFYVALANWLASQGMLVATFDCRGIGQSLSRPLRELEVDVIDWAQSDCEAALRRLREKVGAIPISWLGHSLGGQIMPMVPSHGEIARVITVAAGSGYWRENVPTLRRYSWLLWFVLAPLTMKVCGYFPGRQLRIVGDLPAGVMRQWRRWVLNKHYAVGVEGPDMRTRFASVTAPITGLSFTDDEYLSERNIESLHGFFTEAEVTVHRIGPEQVGVSGIGHFGFFRAGNEEPLWRPYLLPALMKE